MNDDIADGIASAIAVIFVIGVFILAFVKPESAIALCLLAITIFNAMDRL